MRKKFYVILHNIRSAYNVGSIFRTADGLGVDKIYLTGYTPDPEKDRAVSKTALGAEKEVPWEKHWHINTVIKKLRKQKVKIYAIEQGKRSVSVGDFVPKGDVAIIMGNEVKGISDAVCSKTDGKIEISMEGKKESFNVSVAFGIVGYDVKNKLEEKK